MKQKQIKKLQQINLKYLQKKLLEQICQVDLYQHPKINTYIIRDLNRKRSALHGIHIATVIIGIKKYTCIVFLFLVCFDRGIASLIVSEWFGGLRTFSIDANYPTSRSIIGFPSSIGTMALTVHMFSTAAFDCKYKKRAK